MGEHSAQTDGEISPREVPEEGKFNFGPRIRTTSFRAPGFVKAPVGEPNIESKSQFASTASKIATKYLAAVGMNSAVADRENISGNSEGCADPFSQISELKMRIQSLERERDEWKKKAEDACPMSLGEMVAEIELESLREEVSRLRSLLNAAPSHETSDKNSETETSSALRKKCAELETLVVSLKKDKSTLESKQTVARNADQARIRSLEEQVANERRMRERIVATESSLPVVNVSGVSGPVPASVVVVRPRTGSASSESSTNVPTFIAEAVGAGYHPDISKNLAKTMILPMTSSMLGADGLGDDEIAEAWRSILTRDNNFKYKSVLSREAGTNVFKFGSKSVTCKKLGNIVMANFSNQSMVLDKFISTYGPEECSDVVDSARVTKNSKPNTPGVTMKGLKSAAAR